jgi:hypothetical protein
LAPDEMGDEAIHAEVETGMEGGATIAWCRGEASRN